MKVIAFNGSPNKEGNTYHLIRHALDAIEKAGIKTEIIQIGGTNVHPCIACGKCLENKDMQCIQDNDMVNECIGKMIEADAIIIGTPTYFAGVTPEIKAFMDRAFLVGKANDDMFRQKLEPGSQPSGGPGQSALWIRSIIISLSAGCSLLDHDTGIMQRDSCPGMLSPMRRASTR